MIMKDNAILELADALSQVGVLPTQVSSADSEMREKSRSRSRGSRIREEASIKKKRTAKLNS